MTAWLLQLLQTKLFSFSVVVVMLKNHFFFQTETSVGIFFLCSRILIHIHVSLNNGDSV